MVVVVVAGLEGVKRGEEGCDEEATVAVVDTEVKSLDGVEVALTFADGNREAAGRRCTGVENC
jgi:hypothetical protein